MKTVGIIGGSGLYALEGITGVETVSVDTPWGKFTSGTLLARLLPTAPLEQRHAEIQLDAVSAQTPCTAECQS